MKNYFIIVGLLVVYFKDMKIIKDVYLLIKWIYYLIIYYGYKVYLNIIKIMD